MLTVTRQLNPLIVLSHLLTGLAILSTLWWAWMSDRTTDEIATCHPERSEGSPSADEILRFAQDDNANQNDSRRFHPTLIKIGALIVAMQIILGGWVSTHYAALACIDFPYCNGKILPTLQLAQFNTDLITIHMLHRIGALVTGIYLALLSIALIRQPNLRGMGVAILTLVTLQISLGILNVIWLRPVWLALIHHGVAIILLLTIIAALVKATITARLVDDGAKNAPNPP